MKQNERNNIYQKAIDKWGKVAQIEMLQEEATELALAARKFIRKPESNYKNLASEIADVEIMIEQMKFMHPELESDVEHEKEFKINRLETRITNNIFTD